VIKKRLNKRKKQSINALRSARESCAAVHSPLPPTTQPLNVEDAAEPQYSFNERQEEEAAILGQKVRDAKTGEK